MILLTILVTIALLLLAFMFFVITVGGATFTVIFGDVIVCVVLIGLLIKFILSRKKRR